jgi:serine/threonine-protein kinase
MRLDAPANVERFRLEARTLAELDDPHIVPVYDIDEHRGAPYFSMKLIDGGSLDRAGPPKQAPADEKARLRWAAELAATVARAVHAAHQHGILHRDLKPANILLGRMSPISGWPCAWRRTRA